MFSKTINPQLRQNKRPKYLPCLQMYTTQGTQYKKKDEIKYLYTKRQHF